ncbi:MAG: hypothetical protein QUS07_04335, partial [Methanothrix sp.]|nr:hypothetical protein [Methanothrix sp.]
VKIYDLCEADGMLTATSSSLNLPAGLSDGSYNAQIPGRHMLFLVGGDAGSNIVIIDVSGASGSWNVLAPAIPFFSNIRLVLYT